MLPFKTVRRFGQRHCNSLGNPKAAPELKLEYFYLLTHF